MKAQPSLKAFLTRLSAPLLHVLSCRCVVSALSTSVSDNTRNGHTHVLMSWRCFCVFCSAHKAATQRQRYVQSGSLSRLLFACPSTGACSFFLHVTGSFNQVPCVCVCFYICPFNFLIVLQPTPSSDHRKLGGCCQVSCPPSEARSISKGGGLIDVALPAGSSV